MATSWRSLRKGRRVNDARAETGSQDICCISSRQKQWKNASILDDIQTAVFVPDACLWKESVLRVTAARSSRWFLYPLGWDAYDVPSPLKALE